MEVGCWVFINVLVNVCSMCIYYTSMLLAVTLWIFIWFGGIVPISEKSFGSFVLSIGVVYLLPCIVGVMECSYHVYSSIWVIFCGTFFMTCKAW